MDASNTATADLGRLGTEAEAMTGAAALPRRGGDLAVDEPWQGRAVALALETVRGLGLPWDEFRVRLIAAIGDDPDRPYYESWLTALERLVTDHRGADVEELLTHRMRAASYVTDESGDDDLEVFPVAVNDDSRASLGLSLGVPDLPRCAHAELQRQWIDGAPRRWVVRTYDGAGNEQVTIDLPNPFFDDDGEKRREPDWGRLALWDGLRERLLHLPPDPLDRTG